jgi:hypothetical protein
MRVDPVVALRPNRVHASGACSKFPPPGPESGHDQATFRVARNARALRAKHMYGVATIRAYKTRRHPCARPFSRSDRHRNCPDNQRVNEQGDATRFVATGSLGSEVVVLDRRLHARQRRAPPVDDFVSIEVVNDRSERMLRDAGMPFSQPMFRAMKKDADGLPLLGRSGRELGVRVDGLHRDLAVAVDGT